MTNALLGLKTALLDISCRPTRIQDIPRDVLGRYGIVIVNEEGAVSDEEEDNELGPLIIDEGAELKPNVKSEICHKFLIEEPDVSIITEIGRKKSNKSRKEMKEAIQQFQISTSKDMKNFDDIVYCNRCKKLTNNSLEHIEKHCSFEGCPDLIETEIERQRHNKMHDHPTKPLQCKFCRKRYRYHSYVEKHALYCKVKRKAPTAKENWRRETAKANSL